MSHTDVLPRELRHHIYTYLPGRDLVSCSGVCRQWHADLNENYEMIKLWNGIADEESAPSFWRQLVHEHFTPVEAPADVNFRALYQELCQLSEMPVLCGNSLVRVDGSETTQVQLTRSANTNAAQHPTAARHHALPRCWDDAGTSLSVITSPLSVTVPRQLIDHNYVVNYCYCVDQDGGDAGDQPVVVRKVNGLTFTPHRVMQFEDMQGNVVWSEQLPQDFVVNTLNMVFHEDQQGTGGGVLVYSFTNAGGGFGMRAKNLQDGSVAWETMDECNKRMMVNTFTNQLTSTESGSFYRLVSRNVQTGEVQWRIQHLKYNLFRISMCNRFVLLNTHFTQTIAIDHKGQMAFLFEGESVGCFHPISPGHEALPVSSCETQVDSYFIASDRRIARIKAMPVQSIDAEEPKKVGDQHVIWQRQEARDDCYFRVVPIYAGYSETKQDVILIVFAVDEHNLEQIEILRINTIDGHVRWQKHIRVVPERTSATRNRHTNSKYGVYAEIRGQDVAVVSQLHSQQTVSVLDVRNGDIIRQIVV